MRAVSNERVEYMYIVIDGFGGEIFNKQQTGRKNGTQRYSL